MQERQELDMKLSRVERAGIRFSVACRVLAVVLVAFCLLVFVLAAVTGERPVLLFALVAFVFVLVMVFRLAVYELMGNAVAVWAKAERLRMPPPVVTASVADGKSRPVSDEQALQWMEALPPRRTR